MYILVYTHRYTYIKKNKNNKFKAIWSSGNIYIF